MSKVALCCLAVPFAMHFLHLTYAPSLSLVLPHPVDSYGLTEEESPRSAERRCEPGYYCVGGVKESCTPGHWGLGGEITNNCSGLCNLGVWCSRIQFTYIHTCMYVHKYIQSHIFTSLSSFVFNRSNTSSSSSKSQYQSPSSPYFFT